MTNDFKMIVFKQLTISIKTQHDNKINVSCSANQQNVTLLYHMLNMTINTVVTLNLSTEFGALFVFSAFIETLDFFSLKKYVLRSPFHVECKAL
jgi:helix-turn-helix protein